MPTYTFLNKETQQIEEHRMSYKVLDEFKANNPQLEVCILPENLHVMSDGMRMDTPGLKKNDSAFEKYIIQRMKETIPGNTIARGHKTRGSREW
jgi:hypothetical protein